MHFIFSHTAGEISSPATRKLHWWQAQWTTTDNWSLISCYNQLLWNTYIIFLFISHSRIYSRLMVIFSLNFTNCFGFYFLLFKGKYHIISNVPKQSLRMWKQAPEGTSLSCLCLCHLSVVELHWLLTWADLSNELFFWIVPFIFKYWKR